MNWQPIETAPRDGTPILIWQPDADAYFGPRNSWRNKHADPMQYFDDARWAIGYWRPWPNGGWGNRNATVVNPTHWMPLPPPPSSTTTEKDSA